MIASTVFASSTIETSPLGKPLHDHQIEFVPNATTGLLVFMTKLKWVGSLFSIVAFRLNPEAMAAGPTKGIRFVKLSLGGDKPRLKTVPPACPSGSSNVVP